MQHPIVYDGQSLVLTLHSSTIKVTLRGSEANMAAHALARDVYANVAHVIATGGFPQYLEVEDYGDEGLTLYAVFGQNLSGPAGGVAADNPLLEPLRAALAEA